MKKALTNFKLCICNGTNNFTITDNIVKARDSLSAAKKFYRSRKSLVTIFIYDTNTDEIHQYDTKFFFTKKKEHLIKRNNN